MDAPTFKLELTPEAALGIVQKEVQRRGWKKFDVTEIRLVYTPFWTFGFDVLADNAVPTGKAALNAATGDLDETVPVILERPLKRTKATDEQAQAEVENTAISRPEAERVAAVKVAASVGLKKDNVTVSAISKAYLPFYRIWLNVEGAGDFKVNVDALLGIPMGTEQIPSRQKTWDEATGETIDKMKTPAGFISAAGEAASAVGGGSSITQNKPVMWAVMLLAIVVLLFMMNGGIFGSGTNITCSADASQLTSKQYVFFGAQYVTPMRTLNGNLFIRGTCSFSPKGSGSTTACVKVSLMQDGTYTPYSNSTCVQLSGGSSLATQKPFTITWKGSTAPKYTLDVTTLG